MKTLLITFSKSVYAYTFHRGALVTATAMPTTRQHFEQILEQLPTIVGDSRELEGWHIVGCSQLHSTDDGNASFSIVSFEPLPSSSSLMDSKQEERSMFSKTKSWLSKNF